MPKGIPKNGKRKPVKAVMTTQEYIESLERNLNHHVNRLDHVINDCVERIKASEQAIEARIRRIVNVPMPGPVGIVRVHLEAP